MKKTKDDKLKHKTYEYQKGKKIKTQKTYKLKSEEAPKAPPKAKAKYWKYILLVLILGVGGAASAYLLPKNNTGNSGDSDVRVIKHEFYEGGGGVRFLIKNGSYRPSKVAVKMSCNDKLRIFEYLLDANRTQYFYQDWNYNDFDCRFIEIIKLN